MTLSPAQIHPPSDYRHYRGGVSAFDSLSWTQPLTADATDTANGARSWFTRYEQCALRGAVMHCPGFSRGSRGQLWFCPGCGVFGGNCSPGTEGFGDLR